MIDQTHYAQRRSQLLGMLDEDSLAVVFSAKPKVRSNDTEYPYRQNSNFYYLTGFKEDNAALVLVKSKEECTVYLFVQKKDEQLELWTGERLGEVQAKKIFDVQKVFTMDEYDVKIKEFVASKTKIYFDFKEEDERIQNLRALAKKSATHKDISSIVGYFRLIKSDAEIELIRKAISITKEAHHSAMKACRTLEYEYELQAEIEYIFKKKGCYSDAYTSIVACGNSANTLHYVNNNRKLVNEKLILIDAGCEYEYYSSDITRTIPVSGKFTKAQKELYEMVLDVEEKIIKMIKPNILRTSLQKKSEELLCDGMIKYGILQGDRKTLIKNKAHKKYFPHGIGHWMGLDVHDQCPYTNKKGKEIPLAAGMVMTIEPGIYIDENDKSVPKKYRGIGIRIEDDVLVTEFGCENLSKEIVKTVQDIENIS